MARGNPVRWAGVMQRLNQAILLARGTDRQAGTRWLLFGLPGNVYFTIEVPTAGPAVPGIFPCSHEAAVALYDDATCREAETLDVERAVEALRRRLLGG